MPKPVPLWIQRLPNQLTGLRVALIPIVVYFMLQGGEPPLDKAYTPNSGDIWAASLFGLASLTDFFDGWIARRYHVESVLGKLLDPVADKLLVVSAMIILVEKHRLPGWIAVLLIVRDLGINAVRIAALEDGISVPSSWIGKTKTLFLDLGIVGLTVHGTLGSFWHFLEVGWACMILALITSLLSAGQYLWDYAHALRLGNSGGSGSVVARGSQKAPSDPQPPSPPSQEP